MEFRADRSQRSGRGPRFSFDSIQRSWLGRLSNPNSKCQYVLNAILRNVRPAGMTSSARIRFLNCSRSCLNPDHETPMDCHGLDHRDGTRARHGLATHDDASGKPLEVRVTHGGPAHTAPRTAQDPRCSSAPFYTTKDPRPWSLGLQRSVRPIRSGRTAGSSDWRMMRPVGCRRSAAPLAGPGSCRSRPNDGYETRGSLDASVDATWSRAPKLFTLWHAAAFRLISLASSTATNTRWCPL
jgi:hypothetical protein